MSKFLDVSGLTKNFGGITALSELSFSQSPGSILAVIGPNGAGKTTLINLISGIIRPTRGEVFFEGRNLGRMAPHDIASLGVARTFQKVMIFAHMTVLENVMVALSRVTKSGFISGMLSTAGARREVRSLTGRALDVLEKFGLKDQAQRLAGALPLGLQRRLEVARAVAPGPRLLLLDEPAAGMNIAETEEMAALISSLRSPELTTLLVEHDMNLVMSISDEVMVLNYGSLLARGSPDEVRGDPKVISAYLGTRE